MYIDPEKTKLMSFPNVVSDEIVLKSAEQTLNNKSLVDNNCFLINKVRCSNNRYYCLSPLTASLTTNNNSQTMYSKQFGDPLVIVNPADTSKKSIIDQDPNHPTDVIYTMYLPNYNFTPTSLNQNVTLTNKTITTNNFKYLSRCS